MQSPLRKKVAAHTVLVFLAAYFVSLLVWLPIKGGYGYLVTVIASQLAAGLTDAKVEEISSAKGVVQVTFTPLRKKSDILVEIPVPTSSYTFNIPLTAGIMAALPIRLGATIFMGGLSQGSGFALQMLRGSIPSSIGAFAFMLTLARASKHGMPLAFIAACAVYAAIVGAFMVVA